MQLIANSGVGLTEMKLYESSVCLAEVSSQNCTIAPNLYFLYFRTIFFNGLFSEIFKMADKVT
jgi:hypothetical protein